MKRTGFLPGVACAVLGGLVFGVSAHAMALEWRTGDDGKAYWYENGVRQGTYDDAQGVLGDGTIRGREIFDPESNGWYWLDAVYNGAKAVSKEVWMPYVYQDEASWPEEEIDQNAAASGTMEEQIRAAIHQRTGKWVRYDAGGAMVKGWYTVNGDDVFVYPNQAGNTYYYDQMTGLMAKGETTIDGADYFFNERTGVLETGTPPQMEAPRTIPADAVNVLDYGAAVNDTVDDTEAFQEAIETVAKDGTVYVPAGIYRINAEKGISLRSNMSLILDPDAVLEVQGTSLDSYGVLKLAGVHDVTIVGGQISGERERHGGTGGEDGHGVDIRDSTDVRMVWMRISDNWGDGIYLGTASDEDAVFGCDAVTIKNCALTHNRRSNLSIVDADNVTVDGCAIANADGTAPQCGINIEPNRGDRTFVPDDAVCRHIRIVNTTIDVVRKGDLYCQWNCLMSHAWPGRSDYTTSEDVEISHCTFNGDCCNGSTNNMRFIDTTIKGIFWEYRSTQFIRSSCDERFSG